MLEREFPIQHTHNLFGVDEQCSAPLGQCCQHESKIFVQDEVLVAKS
jgi:hypothetical protein